MKEPKYIILFKKEIANTMSKKTKFNFSPATEIQSFIFVRFLAEMEKTNNMFLKEKVIKTLAKINYCSWL